MLIVCPNCATSYEVDQAALGPAGRTVRCARCKATWFAGGNEPEPELAASIDDVIAQAEAHLTPRGQAEPAMEAEPVSTPAAALDADSGAEPAQPVDSPKSAPPAEAETDIGDGTHAAPDTVVEAPSLVPADEHGAPPETDSADPESDESVSYAARRERLAARRKQSRRSSRWTAVALLLFAANVALITARDDVVRYLPQTASLFSAIGLPVNLRHLQFENVKILKDIRNGANVLIVEGTIVSTSEKPVKVPRLRFAARDAAGQEIYTWTALPSRSVLDPGERLNFRSRLASPPADATTVMVRFLDSPGATGVTK